MLYLSKVQFEKLDRTNWSSKQARVDVDTYFTYFPYDTSSVAPTYEQELTNKDHAMGITNAQDDNANNNAKDTKVESGGGTNKPASAGWSRLKNTAKTVSTAGEDSTMDKNPLIQPPSGGETKTESAPSKPKSAGWSRLKGATTKSADAKTEETKPLTETAPAPAETTPAADPGGLNAKTRWTKSRDLLGINANGNVKPILTRTDSLVVPGQTQRPSISFSEGRDSLHSQSEKSLGFGSRRGSRFSGESRFSAIDLSKIAAAQGVPEEEEEEEQTKGIIVSNKRYSRSEE